MKRFLRWAGYGLAGLATVVVFALLGAFAASEVMIRSAYPKVKVATVASRDPAAVERGHKIAVAAGCHDCHGKDLSGKLFHDEPAILRAFAPNLTLAAASQTDAELDSAIRHGVAADGRTLWVMPSESFAHFTDGETADLLAYIRSLPVTGEVQPHIQVGPVGRIGVLLGKFHSAPQMLREEASREPVNVGPQHARGRELARYCIECHGSDLGGRNVMKAPDLTIAAAYDEKDFEKLLRTGLAAGDRHVGLMSQIAPVRFNSFSHEDIAALHDYLKARADKVL